MVSKKSKDTTETVLKYNSETLKSLLSRRPNLNEFVELIKDLLKDEGCKKRTGFNKEVCINLDKVETSTSRKNKQSSSHSMDLTVSLDQNKFMLVEAKFREGDVDDHLCSGLKEKIEESKRFMKNDLHCCLYKDLVILFSQNSKIEQKKSKLRRKMNNVIGIKPMSAMDFHRLYFE